MDHFKRIYTSQAAAYHRLIAAEDVEGNLLPAIERVASLRGKRLLDLGTGTGRIPLLASGRAAQVVALDLHRAMLLENGMQRQAAGGSWPLLQADMGRLPFGSRRFEVVIAGWAISHLRAWYAASWQRMIAQVLDEMHRVLTPTGALIILETLSTGALEPAPPTPELEEYYRWLEKEWGFTRETIRTDYQFDSLVAAIAHTEFFFGPELAARIREHRWQRLPEWTGLWSKSLLESEPKYF